MINRELLEELDKKAIIDKKLVLWWQLGFEGRRIFSEEEFNSNLKKVEHEYFGKTSEDELKEFRKRHSEKINSKDDNIWYEYIRQENEFLDKNVKMDIETLKIWEGKDVPILVKDFEINGLTIPCFVSVKPVSHGRDPLGFALQLSSYYQPHIRGVIIDQTNDFLFWSPFTFGRRAQHYETIARRYPHIEMPIFVHPVNPINFHKNLINQWNSGKGAQKKFISARLLDNENFIPFYDFSNQENTYTVYPAQIYDRKLDFPIVLKGKGSKAPEIIGTGFFYPHDYREMIYIPLNGSQTKNAVKSLIKRLGYII